MHINKPINYNISLWQKRSIQDTHILEFQSLAWPHPSFLNIRLVSTSCQFYLPISLESDSSLPSLQLLSCSPSRSNLVSCERPLIGICSPGSIFCASFLTATRVLAAVALQDKIQIPFKKVQSPCSLAPGLLFQPSFIFFSSYNPHFLESLMLVMPCSSVPTGILEKKFQNAFPILVSLENSRNLENLLP